ncbi:hypothetical protein ACROYT_G030819 [Oculina patagonica]
MKLSLFQMGIYYIVVVVGLPFFPLYATKIIDAQGKALSRGSSKGVSFVNFEADKFSYLNITSIVSYPVRSGSECGFACLEIPSCVSYNLAAYPDVNGKLLCELLPSNKYNNSDKIIASQVFHHFGIPSPCSSWPCKNNGTCVPQYEKNSYMCHCTYNYKGTRCETKCQDTLGMESRSILDDQITASLYTNIDHAPFRARLYNQESAGAWTTGAGQHWLQIDLRNDSIRITRVATQGRYSYDQWVTRYQLQYGHDGANFQYYREQGQTAIKDFSGNTDRNTVVYQELNPPITARYIRFRPTAWNNFIAMRVELYGCQVISANDEVAAKVPQDCSVNNYNNNYYAGPQKNVENLLTDIKKQLDELKTQVTLLALPRRKTSVTAIPV